MIEWIDPSEPDPLLPEPDWYRIMSHAELPDHMQGIFSFLEAEGKCWRWNRRHLPEDRAWPEVAEGQEARIEAYYSEPLRRSLIRTSLLIHEGACQHQWTLQADRVVERFVERNTPPLSEMALMTAPTPFEPGEGAMRALRCARKRWRVACHSR